MDVLFNGREEGRVQAVGLSQLRDVLAGKDARLVVVMKVDHDQTEDLTQVETCNHLLKGLLTRARRVLVDDDIILGAWQDLVLIIKGTPLAVDGHRGVGRQVHVGQLRNRASILHIGGVAASAKDAANLHLGVGVCRGDQSTSGIVDQSGDLDRNSLCFVCQ